MENASKALIIAAEILIGVLLLTLMAVIILGFTNYQTQIEENYEAKEINQFNIKFLVYEGREDLTAQDVVTIYNLAQDYNSKFEGETMITVKLNDKPFNKNQFDYLKEELDKSGDTKYTVTKIERNSNTGLVNLITIQTTK